MVNRRELLVAIGGGGAAMALGSLSEPTVSAHAMLAAGTEDSPLPRKDDFAIRPGLTYLNSAYIHPMPKGAVESVRRNAESLSVSAEQRKQGDVKAEFAALISAKPSEIALVANTSVGENLVVNGLGIPRNDGSVVTDALQRQAGARTGDDTMCRITRAVTWLTRTKPR